MQWYEVEVADLEAKLKNQPSPPGCTAFYGSSSIRMWNGLATDLKDRRAVNLGFGGSTLAACVHFFNRIVPPVHPASLVVYAGDNDLGDGRSPEDVAQSFQSLTRLAQHSLGDTPFGFISIKISPARYVLRDRIDKANQLIKQHIERLPGGYFIDITRAMLAENGKARAEFFLEDGLHLSRAGYKLWAQLLQPYRHKIFTPLSSFYRNK